jgi:hypothetical protein
MAIQISHQWIGRVAALVVGASRVAGALLIAGSVLTFASGQAEATPNKVTKNTPCGSCHPPNKPPKTR